MAQSRTTDFPDNIRMIVSKQQKLTAENRRGKNVENRRGFNVSLLSFI